MCNYLSAINPRSVEFGQCLNQHTGNVPKPKQKWRYHTNVTSRVTTMNMYHNNTTVCWKSYSAVNRSQTERLDRCSLPETLGKTTRVSLYQFRYLWGSKPP